MTAIRRGLVAIALALPLAPATDVRAQGVAFLPGVGAFPNGPALGVTPVVSLDRRYVRLGINAQFTALEGLNTYLVPAAVGSGPSGPGALAGGGGLGGVGGGQVFAGMDGVIAPGMGLGDAGSTLYPYDGTPHATGDLPASDFATTAASPPRDRTGPTRAAAGAAKRGKKPRATPPAGKATSGPGAKAKVKVKAKTGTRAR